MLKRVLVVCLVLISVAAVSAANPPKASTKIKKELKSMQWMVLLRTPTLIGNGPTIRRNQMDGFEEYEITNGAIMVSMVELPPVSKTSFVWAHGSGLEEVQTVVIRSDGEFEDGVPQTGLAVSLHVKTGMVKVTQYVSGQPLVTKEKNEVLAWRSGIPQGARHHWFPIEIWDTNGEIVVFINNNADNPNSIVTLRAKYDVKKFPDRRLMVFNHERPDPTEYRCFFRKFQFEGTTPDELHKQIAAKNW